MNELMDERMNESMKFSMTCCINYDVNYINYEIKLSVCVPCLCFKTCPDIKENTHKRLSLSF